MADPSDIAQAPPEGAPTHGEAGGSTMPIDRRVALAGLLGSVLALASCTSDDDGRTSSEGPADDAEAGNATDRSPTDSIRATDGSSDEAAAVDRSVPSGEPVAETAVVDAPTRPTDPELHVLRRLTFGADGASVERIRSIGVAAWVDEQVEPTDLATSEVDRELADAFPELSQTAPDLIADYRGDGNGPRLASVLVASALDRQLRSPAQLYERMVEFWGDHFNAPQVNPPMIIARIVMDREVIRPHALGRFDDLLVATAQSPAMLRYLDNASSSVGALNENYARELLELHTVGVDGGYDEDDIVSAARLLTGWRHTRELEFVFDERRHDRSPVSILGWDRPTSGDALGHGVDFLRHLARLPETARFVARKLAVRFVADDPDPDLVAAMAQAWIDNDTEIVPVVRAMVEHPSFADAPPKFNRPWDYYVQTLRSLGGRVDVTEQRVLRGVYGAARDLGQVPFRWPSPDGPPDVSAAWLDAGAMLARWNLAAALTAEDLGDAIATSVEDLRGESAAAIVDGLARTLRAQPATDDQVAAVAALTGWGSDDRPGDDELDELAGSIAFVLLVEPTALFR